MRALTTPALLFCLLLLSLGGCVSKSAHQLKVDEAERLSAEVQALEGEFREMLEDRDRLTQRGDDLQRQLGENLARSSALREDLLRARADIERAEKILSAHSTETGAALAEMRQTIDRLQEENRQLAGQLEEERIAKEERLAQMKGTFDELMQKMETEITRGEITISELQGQLTVNMVERILFDSGQAEIKADGLKVLKRVGDILKETEDRQIRVEGHTDNVAISPRLRQTFPSNWELSTARAANVVHFLQKQVGIDGERLAVVGFGEFRPVANNSLPEGRAQNRRIQIILAPWEGAEGN
jgi:chemotaxis protein MotB